MCCEGKRPPSTEACNCVRGVGIFSHVVICTALAVRCCACLHALLQVTELHESLLLLQLPTCSPLPLSFVVTAAAPAAPTAAGGRAANRLTRNTAASPFADVLLCCGIGCDLPKQVAELRESLLLALLPPDSSEDANVVLELRASVGGEWVAGFAEDLLDMYRSFAGEQGWRFEVGVFESCSSCCNDCLQQGHWQVLQLLHVFLSAVACTGGGLAEDLLDSCRRFTGERGWCFEVRMQGMATRPCNGTGVLSAYRALHGVKK